MNKSFLSVFLLVLAFSNIALLEGIRYSAFAPEFTYTQYQSLVADNYTLPEAREMPDNPDSIWFEIPIKNWDSFRRFGLSLVSDYHDDNAIFRYRYQNLGLDFYNRSNFLLGYDGTFFPGSQYNYFYIGFNQQAWLGNNWSFHSQFTYNSLRGDSLRAVQSPLLDGFWKHYGRHFEFGNCTTGITYENAFMKASLGRGRLNIGNSITGSILLNDRVNDYGYLSAEVQVGTFIISLMNAQLVADSTQSIYHDNELNRHNFPNKYFVAHQFTWRPVPAFNMFAGETLVYGNSSLNLSYLLPQGYDRVIADSDHDRDNSTMYTGFDWKLHKEWHFYFQFMMDELRPEKLAHPWWGNKYAYQGGISLLLPGAFVKNNYPRLTVEFTAIRPWTYTHYLMYDKYSQDNRCLGFPYGANLLHYATKLEVPLPMDCSFTSYASFMRQGVGPDYGPYCVGNNFLSNSDGTITDSYNYPATWLQGEIVNTYRLENSLRINVLKHQRLFFSQAAEVKGLGKWDNQFVLGWQLVY